MPALPEVMGKGGPKTLFPKFLVSNHFMLVCNNLLRTFKIVAHILGFLGHISDPLTH